jgi:tRNA pseudouridine13 synthase
MEVLEVEKAIGIEIFYTPFDGIGGKLKQQSQDFSVTEISNYPYKVESGKYLIAEVTAINWETNLLIRELSKHLRISRERISFAGTKDKRAKTTRLMSFYNVSPSRLSKLKIKDVEIKTIYSSNKPIKIGNLAGNKFKIIVRNIDEKVNLYRVKNIANYIIKNDGFPNFFGIQRFGISRPITHTVGKFIIKDDFENAVMTYIANPLIGEDDESYKAREELERTHDYTNALKSFPDYLNYEKAILNKLVNNPEDYVSAIKELPKNLLTMFVYAYQSYLFNKILSERIRKNLPINKAIEGDIILPIRNGVIDKKGILTKKNNLKKINRQISKEKAAVSGVLYGCDSIYSDGKMGEIERKVIDSEKLDPRDFIVSDIPHITSPGSRRQLNAVVKNFKFKLVKDELNEYKKALNIEFTLGKGNYATSLLREFMKSDDIKNY